MNVPYAWLRELVPDLPDAAATSELLDGLGLAVEAVHELPAAPSGVIVAEIVAALPELTLEQIGDLERAEEAGKTRRTLMEALAEERLRRTDAEAEGDEPQEVTP